LKVINSNNGLVLANRADVANTLLSRMKGLLGRKSLGPGEGLVITPCVSIHTFGMRFGIDVIFFDGANRAVAVLSEVKPYRATRLYPSAAGVIELPSGTLKSSPVDIGDELEFIP